MRTLYKSFPFFLASLFVSNALIAQETDVDRIYKVFQHPRDSVQTSVYWYWMSGNISKDGAIKDLEAMKREGINRAFIGIIQVDEIPAGPVKFLSDEWWDIMHATMKRAGELGIDIGVFNSPGWSQSGGPWVKPEHSMRYVTSSETLVKDGQAGKYILGKPHTNFQDIRTLAYPVPKGISKTASQLFPVVNSVSGSKNAEALMDQKLSTEFQVPLDSTYVVDIRLLTPFNLQGLSFTPSDRPIIVKGKLQVERSGGFETIKEFIIDRSNPQLNVGFNPYGKVLVSVPETRATHFRLVFDNHLSNYDRSWGPRPLATAGIQEMDFLSNPVVDSYIEKSLAKMSQTPFPLWGQYLWKEAEGGDSFDKVIDPKSIQDITHLRAGDTVFWKEREGDWIIQRIGMAPTGVTNSPAPPDATGPEVDKMNKKWLPEHFEGFIGQILKRIPAEDRKAFKVVVQDSYETGGQNWTDEMELAFFEAYGYDPKPYLPVFSGRVVGSRDQSDRFLWDVRRLVADRLSKEYVGGLAELCHQNGLTTWLENYGHWGFPGEFLQYGSLSDEIGGEFWSEGSLGNIENKAASSSAHIYGKTKVSAESFTCGGRGFSRSPGTIKARGDRFFAEGINNTLLHLYIQQPDDKKPGINAPFGNEFNRHNTWFEFMDQFTDYLKRCNYLLQQGVYVADVAYFIGEDAPKMTGVCDPPLPRGYSYDYINADVIKNRITIKNGHWTLPNGISYKMLVLPKQTTMRPELLTRIKELVEQGGVLYGQMPKESPSLQNWPTADEKVKSIASTLWLSRDTINEVGEGLVIEGMEFQKALDFIKAKPDYFTKEDNKTLFLHRKAGSSDLYFISNQKDTTLRFDAKFAVGGKAVKIWDPVSGEIYGTGVREITKKSTTVDLELAPLQSLFVFFDGNEEGGISDIAEGESEVLSIYGPWKVSFDSLSGGPRQVQEFTELSDWSESANDSIKYYSGKASYRSSFVVDPNNYSTAILELEKFGVMVRVKVNGKEAGSLWTAPYQLNITPFLKKGKNSIEIEVINNWMNRIIGDQKETTTDHTWLTVNEYSATSKLQPSGLIGGVKVHLR